MYHKKQSPELQVDLSLSKVLVIAITIFATLIIPIQIVTQSKQTDQTTTSVASTNQSNSEARVAGASTNVNNDLLSKLNIDTNTQAGQFFLVGVFLLGLSVLIMIYLLINSSNRPEYSEATNLRDSL